MDSKLNGLLRGNALVWRGRGAGRVLPGVSTGFSALDAALPTGGWPANALIEVNASRWGVGELRLLLPTLRALREQGRWVAWVGPPLLPYAPALAKAGLDVRQMVLVQPGRREDVLWSLEKLLRAPRMGAVLGWPPRLSLTQVRRLQLAAEAGGSLGFMLSQVAQSPSAAALRIQLEATPSGLRVRVLKARGGCRHAFVDLDLSAG